MAPVLRHCPCLRPENDDVKTLDYSHSNLDDVPNEVFSFERTLEELYLDANQIKDLPRPLFHCHGLRKLNLSDNEINGLPPAFGSLINLEQLDISKNGVVEIPDNIKGCKCLSLVDASVNPLGKLPEGFTQLINLQELYLNDTFLEYLPANFGRLSRLRILELRENHLKVLPKSMARLTELCRLDIGQNDFSDLPEVIANLPRLVELWCDNNNLNCLPPFLGGLKKLTYLDASKNRIYDVAEEIEGCTSLCDLTLSSNRIKELPDGLVNLRKMTVLRVDLNRLIDLPMNIGNLTCMEELVLSSNDLSRLPYTIGLMRNLKTLIADDNLLEELPCEMGSCQKLSILSLRDNKLLHIPDELGHIAALKVINLSGNLLQYLPFSIAKLPNLQALWLSENQNKPLVPLQSDTDKATSQKVLTCFMLPQVPLEEDDKHTMIGKMTEEITSEVKGRQLIKFAFDLEKDKPSKLVRAPTPYPKELKAHARHARNYALKKQGFKEPDINDMCAKNARIIHNNMEAMRCKGAPPDIMVLPSATDAKLKDPAAANPKSPSTALKKELQSDSKVNTQSSVESSGSDAATKSLGRRDSRGDGSSSENTSSSPVSSPKTSGHTLAPDAQASTLDSRYRKSNVAGSNKKDSWMRQRLVRQGSGDSDRGYRSDHEVYLIERDQYGIYGTHSDGYASDWEAFMAKQNYANNPMMQQYGRPAGFRGDAEGHEMQGDIENTYWPNLQYAEGQPEHGISKLYPEMVMNQQGYWQADPSYAQQYQNYDASQQFQVPASENPAYYYMQNEVPLQPAEFYQNPGYPPQQQQQQQHPQFWAARPQGLVGSKTLPRRFVNSSPRPKRSQCISVQAPLHSTPQEYHLMPQGHPNMRPVSPGNSPLPGRSPSPRIETKFTYPPPRMPGQNPYPPMQYQACPITSQPMNTIQFPTPLPQNTHYQPYHEDPTSPRMKHNVQQSYTSAEDPMPQMKSYSNAPGVHSSNYYMGRMSQSDYSEHLMKGGTKHYPNEVRNSIVGHEHYSSAEPGGFGGLQYRTASIPMQMQNLEYVVEDVSPISMSHLNRSVPCINIIPSTSPPYIEQPHPEPWNEDDKNTKTDINTEDTPNSVKSPASPETKTSDIPENVENQVENQSASNCTSESEVLNDESKSVNNEKVSVSRSNSQNSGVVHVQGVFKAMPLRNTVRTSIQNSMQPNTVIYSVPGPVGSVEATTKKASDYENLEALQYHDYQNLPPVSSSTSSSLMKNFKKECDEIKKNVALVSSKVTSNNQENPGHQEVEATNQNKSKCQTKNVVSNMAVASTSDSNTKNTKPVDSTCMVNEHKTTPVTQFNNVNASSGQSRDSNSKGSYAISSLDTVISNQPKPSIKIKNPLLNKSSSTNPNFTQQPDVYTSTHLNSHKNHEQMFHKTELPKQKSVKFSSDRPSVADENHKSHITANLPKDRQTSKINAQSSTNAKCEDSQSSDKRFQKVLPPFDKSIQLKPTNTVLDNSHSSSPVSLKENPVDKKNNSGGQTPNPSAKNNSGGQMQNPSAKNNSGGQLQNPSTKTEMNKPSSMKGNKTAIDSSQAKVTPVVPPKPQISCEPIVHSKSTSNKIASVTQQLINCINKNEPSDKNMPDLISRVDCEEKDKFGDSVTNLESEDKILNNKVSLSQKIITTDQEQNDIDQTDANVLESPKSPKRNHWFFGTHKNTLVFPVVIAKNPGAGFTIEGGIGTVRPSTKAIDHGIYVAHVASDGPANGALRPGDKILQANGVDFAHLHLEKAASLLNSNEPTLSLMISRK